MADDPDNPEAAANRLEAALDKIALLVATQPTGPSRATENTELSLPELTERIDSLISRIRAVLVRTG